MQKYLWGSHARLAYLILATMALLFCELHLHPLWPQEKSFAQAIVTLLHHPHAFQVNGLTAEAPSPFFYWLTEFFVSITRHQSVWELRLPAAFAGVLSVWCLYQMGKHLKNESLGLLAGWMLITTYFFVTWGRMGTEAMLHLAGFLFALAWYFIKRDQARFFDYLIFFIILSINVLAKNLLGAITPLVLIVIDVLLNRSWKRHCKLALPLATLPAIILYFILYRLSLPLQEPFFTGNSLWLIAHEHLTQFSQLLNVKMPSMNHVIALPMYLIPWIFLFLPAIVIQLRYFNTLSTSHKWLMLSFIFLFILYLFDYSQQNNHALLILPFALLLTAEWITSISQPKARRKILTTWIILLTYGFLFFSLDIYQLFLSSKTIFNSPTLLNTTSTIHKP